VTRAPRQGETAPATEHRTITGRWRSENGRYTIEVQLEGQQTAWPVEIANDRLQIPSANPPLAFERDSV
jgi:hypothetical protein